MPLTLDNLTSPKENSYYTIALVFSILAWLAVLLSLVGIVYALLLGFFLWLVNGLLIGRLKSEAVEVNEDQLPLLYKTFQEVSTKFGLTRIPKLYIVESAGHLNAFATRHSGRDFVVVFSDLLEAFGVESPEMKFILGHEIGHIRQKHLFKRLLLFPGLMPPSWGMPIGGAVKRPVTDTAPSPAIMSMGPSRR